MYRHITVKVRKDKEQPTERFNILKRSFRAQQFTIRETVRGFTLITVKNALTPQKN